ncbi:hypothetical protein B0H34DRAFT_237467 [Crassisporium funariophilum]|nr:hypothetical protein B0H34DRAFT_237467 [Crassisporium funariophilum]
MDSTFQMKQEEQPIQLYTIDPISPSEPHWTPNYSRSPHISPLEGPYPPHHEVALAKAFCRSLRYDRSTLQPRDHLRNAATAPSSSSFPESLALSHPASASSSRLVSASEQSQSIPRPRIPRPPNAFMLFRSDFLKKNLIPRDVEARQQNLSRIVGQLWNMLDPDERAKWHKQAAEVLKEHQLKNPDYKFTPAPRGSKKNKIKTQKDTAVVGEDNARSLRETYLHVLGPAPERKRRTKKVHSVDSGKLSPIVAPLPIFKHGLPYPYPPTVSSAHPVFRFDQSPPLSPFRPRETFPQPVLPRRPSTSMGFQRNNGRGEMCYRPAADIRISSTRPPSTAATSNSFCDFVRAHGQQHYPSPQPLPPANYVTSSAPSSPTAYDHAMWAGYTMNTIPNVTEAIHRKSPEAATQPQQAESPPTLSVGLYEPVNTNNARPTFVEEPSIHLGEYEPVDQANNAAFLASLGFPEDMLSLPSMKPPFENSEFSDGVPKNQLWLSAATVDLDQWDYESLYTAGSEFAFTVGDVNPSDSV